MWHLCSKAALHSCLFHLLCIPCFYHWVSALGHVWMYLAMKDLRASLMVLVVENPPASARAIRDVGSVPRSGRFPRGGNPLQYSCLETPKDKGIWWLHSMGHKESDTTKQPNTHILLVQVVHLVYLLSSSLRGSRKPSSQAYALIRLLLSWGGSGGSCSPLSSANT